MLVFNVHIPPLHYNFPNLCIRLCVSTSSEKPTWGGSHWSSLKAVKGLLIFVITCILGSHWPTIRGRFAETLMRAESVWHVHGAFSTFLCCRTWTWSGFSPGPSPAQEEKLGTLKASQSKCESESAGCGSWNAPDSWVCFYASHGGRKVGLCLKQALCFFSKGKPWNDLTQRWWLWAV